MMPGEAMQCPSCLPSTGANLKPALKYGLALWVSPRTYFISDTPPPRPPASLTRNKSLCWRRISQDRHSLHGLSYDLDLPGLDKKAATVALSLILVSSN